jgi:hypothetical protein
MSSDIRRISTVLQVRVTSVVSAAVGFTVVVLMAVSTGVE